MRKSRFLSYVVAALASLTLAVPAVALESVETVDSLAQTVPTSQEAVLATDSILGFDGTFETFEIGKFTDGKGDAAVTKVIAENTNPDASGKALKLTATSNTSYKWGLVGKYIALDDTKDYVISFDVWRDQNDTTPENCTMQFGIGAHSSNDIGYGANILTLTVNTFGTANAGVKQTVSGVVTAEQLQAATVGDKGYWWSIQFRNVNNATIWVDNISIEEYVSDPILGFDGSFESKGFTLDKTDGGATALVATNTNPGATGKALKITATSDTRYPWGLIGKYIKLDYMKNYIISLDVWRDQDDTAPEDCTVHFGIGAHSSNDIGYGANIVAINNSNLGTANAGVKQTVTGVVTAEQLQAADGDQYWLAIQFRNVNDATIWVDNISITPVLTFAGTQIRKDETIAGIRFASHVGEALKTASEQSGFVVAITDALGESELAFDTANAPAITEAGKTVSGTTENGVAYLASANYVKDGGDIVYADTVTGNELFGLENADGTYYTVVLTGFDQAYTKGETTYANRYAVDFTVRAYALVDGTYYYGTPCVNSMEKVAVNYLESEDADLKAFAQVVVDTAWDVVKP